MKQLARIEWWIGAMLFVVVIVGLPLFLVLWWELPQHRPFLQAITALTGSLPLALAAFVAAVSFRTNARRDKLHKSFEFLQRLNDPDATKRRVRLEKESVWQNRDPGAVYQLVEGDTDLCADVNNLLGLFEDAAIAMKRDYLDEEMLFRSMEVVILKAYGRMKPYISGLQATDLQAGYFEELDDLVGAWSNRKSVVDGKPLLV
jgi:hypothetical protein